MTGFKTFSQHLGPDLRGLSLLPQNLDCLIVTASAKMSSPELIMALNQSFPQAQKHIATSCQGHFNQDELCLGITGGVFGIKDPLGAYGSASGSLNDGEDLTQLVSLLLETASLRADRSGELPSLIWMSATPGVEEGIIEAIELFFQTKVPVCGGSAADEGIDGEWWVADQYQGHTSGLTLTVMYPSVSVFTRLSSGYFQTEHKGVVTRCEKRVLQTIDDQPAAEVYQNWCRTDLDQRRPRKILNESTFAPLATLRGALGPVSYFQVIHPREIFADQSMSIFADVEVGQTLYLLKGDEESVVGRARRVVKRALVNAECKGEEVKGALIIFCAGCFLAVGHRLDEIRQSVTQELPDTPLLCQFTFGEQGVFPQGECVHGNLMISVTIFV